MVCATKRAASAGRFSPLAADQLHHADARNARAATMLTSVQAIAIRCDSVSCQRKRNSDGRMA
jgi:hypothetical protein